MTKVSVILNLTELENEEVHFIDNLNNQSLNDIEIIILIPEQNKLWLDQYRELYHDAKKIIFYSDTEFENLYHKFSDIISGEYIYFAQSNTILHTSALNNMYKSIVENQSDVQICNYNIDGQNKNSRTNIYYSQLKSSETFTPQDKKEILFNIVAPEISNYLFKTSFIKQNDLLSDYFTHKSEVFFILKALIFAKNISYFHKLLITHKHYLWQNEINWPDIFNALDTIYEHLQQNELTEMYLQSFLNCYINSIHFLLKGCSFEPLYSEIVKYIKSKIEKKYHLLKYNQTYYHNVEAYKTYTFLFYRDLSFYRRNKIQVKNEDSINIVLAADEQTVPYVGVTLCSILDYASEKNFYNICILHNSISQQAITRLSSLSRNNVRITFTDIFAQLADLHIKKFSAFQDQNVINILIPQIFSQYEKLIYVDSFVQLTQDIAELYKTNIKGLCVVQIPLHHLCSSTQKSKILIYNPYICNRNLFSEKCIALYRNYKDDASFDSLTDIAQLCKKNTSKTFHASYRCIFPQTLSIEELSGDFMWWQYTRKTEFYEWILYNLMTDKTSRT